MKNELIREIAYTMNIKYQTPMDEVVNLLSLQMAGYEVKKIETAIAFRSKDENGMYFRKFLVAKKVAGCTDKTIKMYGDHLRIVFNDIQKNVLDVTSDDIILFTAMRMKDGTGKVTCSNYLRVLSSFYNWMSREEYITKNPMNKVDPIKCQKRKNEKALDNMQVAKLRNACRNEFDSALIEILLSTGCRASEVARIKISEIDFQNGQIQVLGKGEKYRTVYLSAAAILAIKAYLEKRTDGNPYLFPKGISPIKVAPDNNEKEIQRLFLSHSRKGDWWMISELVTPNEPAKNDAINSYVKRVAKLAGLEGVHAHLLRKTFATNALRAGMPLLNVSKLLGHMNIATTQIYLTYNENDIKHSHELYVR